MNERSENRKSPDHKKQINRLSRISGQLNGVKKMIEDQRYCPDIIKQLKAARSAIKSLEHNILETHISNCVVDTFTSEDRREIKRKIEELTDLYKWSN